MRRRPSRRPISHIDLTALVDVAFLLLAFFLLSSRFKPAGVVDVDVPVQHRRHVGCSLPVSPRITIIVNQAGAVYLNFHDPRLRARIVLRAAMESGLELTPQAVLAFSRTEDFGGSARRLFTRLNTNRDEAFPLILEDGIPMSKTDNELAYWLKCAKKEESRLVFQVRADGDAAFPAVDAVVATLQENGINQFSLLTHLVQDHTLSFH